MGGRGMPAPLPWPDGPLPIDVLPALSAPSPDGPDPHETGTGTLAGRRAAGVRSADALELRFGSGRFDDPSAALARLRIDSSTAATSIDYPLGLERALAVAGLDLVERVALLHDRPCVILEWRATGPVRETDALRLDADLRFAPHTGDAPELHWRTGSGVLRLDAARTTLCLLSHDDVRFAVRQAGEGVRCSIAIPLGPRAVRLVIAAAIIDGDDLDSTLDLARDASSRVRARAASLRRRDRECLTLRSSDPAADDRLRTAVRTLDASPLSSPDTLRQIALAAMAAGMTDTARDLIARASDHGPRGPYVPDLGTAFFAWTGDPRFLPPGRYDADPPDSITPGITPPHPGPAPAATGPEGSATPDATAVAWPILQLVRDILGVQPDAARGRIRLRPLMPESWTRCEVANLTTGDARIRIAIRITRPTGTAAREGIASSTRATGAAPAEDTERSGPGADLVVRRLEIEIQQTHGAIPVRAVLEPVVRARALVSASVDGQPAALTACPLGDHIQVPVQLVLDDTRRLVLDFA